MRKNFGIIYSVAVVLFFCGLILTSSALAENGQKKLYVGTFESAPFAYKNELGNWEGMAIDLWASVAKNIGWEYELVEIKKDEAVNEILNGKIDFVVGDFPVKPDRAQIIEFSQPFYAADMAAAVIKKSTKPLAEVLFDTFLSKQFLSLVIGLFILLGIVGFVIWRIERKCNTDFGNNILSWMTYSVYWAVSMMTGVGEPAPRSNFGKIFAICWIFTGLVITSAFIASVTSIITLEQNVQTVITERDLPHRRLAMVVNTAEDYMRRSGATVIVCPNLTECFKKLENRKVEAVIMSEPVLKYYAGKFYPGKFLIISIGSNEVFFAFAGRKQNPLFEFLNLEVIKMTRSLAWADTLNRHLNY